MLKIYFYGTFRHLEFALPSPLLTLKTEISNLFTIRPVSPYCALLWFPFFIKIKPPPPFLTLNKFNFKPRKKLLIVNVMASLYQISHTGLPVCVLCSVVQFTDRCSACKLAQNILLFIAINSHKIVAKVKLFVFCSPLPMCLMSNVHCTPYNASEHSLNTTI